MSLGPATMLYDASGNPIAVALGSAIGTSQSGLVTAGTDYASSPLAHVAKIDASGNQYVVPGSTTGVQLPVAVNAAGSSAGNFGTISLGWDSTSGYWRPFQVDVTGTSVTRAALSVTAAFAPGAAVNTTANSGKSMLSIYNASTTGNYMRLVALYLMCPAQAGVSSGLLSTSSYTTVGMGIARFTTAHTAGTVIPSAVHDSRDTLDTNITARTGATISGQAATFLRLFDAASNSSFGYGRREDDSTKLWTFAPGEGVTCQCLSSVGTGGVSFYVTAVISQNTV